MNRIVGVYSIRNEHNDKRYIGCSINIEKRWKSHKYMLKNNKHENSHLQGAYNKYGEDAFEYSILECCDMSVLKDREEYWIAYYDSKNNGYNMCDGGGKLTNPTTDVCKKISQNLTGDKNGMYGVKLFGKDNSWYGHHHSEQSKQIMSQKAKERIGGKASRSLRVMASTGEKFCNAVEAAKWVGLKDGSTICKVCKGQLKTTGRHPITGEKLGWRYY